MDARFDLLLRSDLLRQRVHRHRGQMDASTANAHHVLQFKSGRCRRCGVIDSRTWSRFQQVNHLCLHFIDS